MNEDAAREIFPVTMGSSEVFTDFRALPVSADTPDEEEEEQTDPKAESAPESVESSELPPVIEVKEKVSPVPPPAAKVTTPPKAQKGGSQTS